MSRLLTPPSTQVAPLWRRFAAMIYDSVVLIGLWIFTTFLVTAAFGLEQSRTIENGTAVFNPFYRLAVQATVVGTAGLFFGWFWTFSGQTLGMQAWKIRVQNADNTALLWRQVALRLVTAPLALLLVGAGYWWMLGDRQRRTWPDLASRSVVVKIDAIAK